MQNIAQNKALDNHLFPNQHNIPVELKALPQFVVWKLQARPGATKSTKIPYNAKTGRAASSADPQTWATFDVALKAYSTGRYTGIGFVFENGYCGVDLDDCREPMSGKITDWAMSLVRRLDSYTEISPSGTGLHILMKAKLDGKGARRNGIELYDQGRYFTLTGRHLIGTPQTINERQEFVSSFYKAIREVQEGGQEISEILPLLDLTLDDARLLEIAAKAKNGERFERLRSGDISYYGNDRSRADLAYVSLLCFYSQDDAQVERLWKQSGLNRDKLERADYVKRTIQKARSRQTKSYGAGRQIPTTIPLDDISDLEEIRRENPRAYGLRVKKDPRRERYLRQCASHASLVPRCSMAILRLLGFKKNHSRFLTALLVAGGPRLGIFIRTDEQLLDWYQEEEGRSSKSTFKRDRTSFMDEQREIGQAPIHYIHGRRYINSQTGEEIRYGSKYQNRLLRVCLECISRAIDLRADDQTIESFDKALEMACEELIHDKTFPVPPPKEGHSGGKRKEKRLVTLERRMSDLDGKWMDELLNDRKLNERQKWEKFEKLQSERRVRFQEKLKRQKSIEKADAPIRVQNEPL